MPVLNAQTVGNAYPPVPGQGASLAQVWNSKGGWFSVTNAGAYVKLQYGGLGADHWTDEILLGAGAFVVLPPNCIGMQFRNSVANAISTVTAQIAQGDEPPLAISSIGQTNVVSVASLNFQHGGVAVGTEPTLNLIDAAGVINWTVADNVAQTRVDVTPAFTSPALFPGNVGVGGNAGDTTISRLAAGVLGITTAFSTGPTTAAAGGGGTAGIYHGASLNMVTAAAGTTVLQTSITTDTQPRLNVTAAGVVSWGAGGASATDVSLSRGAASTLTASGLVGWGGVTSIAIGQGTPGGILDSTGRVLIWRTANSSPTFGITLNGDTQWRFAIDANGTQAWSTGAAVSDLSMARAVRNTVTLLDISGSAPGTTGIAVNGGTPNLLTTSGWALWSSVQSMVGTAAGNNAYVSGVQAESTYRFLIQADGAVKWGGGSVAADVILSRAVTNPTPAHLNLSTSMAFAGSTYEALTTASPVPTTSVTPDYNAATSFIYTVGGTGGGTLTINNATNPPAAAQTAWLYIQISNPPGNTATALAWGGAYTFTAVGGAPATVAQAGFWRLFFVWTGASWLCLIKLNA